MCWRMEIHPIFRRRHLNFESEKLTSAFANALFTAERRLSWATMASFLKGVEIGALPLYNSIGVYCSVAATVIQLALDWT